MGESSILRLPDLASPSHESVSKMGLNMVGAAVTVADASDGTEPENPYDGQLQQTNPRPITEFQIFYFFSEAG